MLVVNDYIEIPDAEIEIQFTRSSGPGGQNVNKTNTKVNISWNIAATPQLSAPVRERFKKQFATKITSDGFVHISSDRFRDQSRNIDDCLIKLKKMILAVYKPPKTRLATKPTKASQRRRLDEKGLQKKKKEQRKSPRWD